MNGVIDLWSGHLATGTPPIASLSSVDGSDGDDDREKTLKKHTRSEVFQTTQSQEMWAAAQTGGSIDLCFIY